MVLFILHHRDISILYELLYLLLLFSPSVVSLYLQPRGLQNDRLPCPSPFLRVCSNSYPLRRWRHPTISSSVEPFSSCHQSFRASEFFSMSWLFASDGLGIEASASAWVFPNDIQGWFPLGLTGLIFLLSRGFSKVFSSTTIQKHRFFSDQCFLLSSSYIHTQLLEKP